MTKQEYVIVSEETEMVDYNNILEWKDMLSKGYRSLKIWDRL